MVAIGDFGISEREDMVRLALSRQWIDNAHRSAVAGGMSDPVVLLVAIDALDVLPFRWDRSPRDRLRERKQRAAGCKPFVVATVSYADLLASNGADGWADDMDDMRRAGGVAVVVINHNGQLFASFKEYDCE
jgi:hypothetical protein